MEGGIADMAISEPEASLKSGRTHRESRTVEKTRQIGFYLIMARVIPCRFVASHFTASASLQRFRPESRCSKCSFA